MSHKWETWEAILGRLGLEDAPALALLNSGLEKVDAFYAEQDAADARREGRQ